MEKSREIPRIEPTLIASHPQSQAVLQAACRIASETAPLLITGETGVGKKTLARYIHQLSSQSHHPLKIIYCGMDADQLEAYSQEANLLTKDTGTSGIVLLDEVVEMTLHLQKRLLMLLREWEMDSNDSGKSWRLISLTRDPSRLLKMVKNSEFLADLYYRISVYSLDITPLRERVADILPLTDYFLDLHLSDGGSAAILGNGVAERLETYAWPGNVQELSNVIRNSLLSRSSDQITLKDLKLENNAVTPVTTREFVPESPGNSIKMTEYELILDTLRSKQGSRKLTAEQLGLKPRTLRYKLARMREKGIEIPSA